MPLLREPWLQSELKSAKTLPLIVIDYRVYAHQIHNFTESAKDIVGEDEEALRKVARALWAYRLNRGIDSIPTHDFTALVVDDSKGEFGEGKTGYWRHIEAEKLGMPEYKGNRGEKPSLFPLILEEGYKYLRSPGSTFNFFDKEYYEADDIAGKIARIQRETYPVDRHILLNTVDGDWQGLVSDQHKIIWCSTGPWLPRIRTETEVCDYYLRKSKLQISTARETYTVKVEIGDDGDNLKPGTPLRFFDLYDEDEQWGWTDSETKELTRMLCDTTQSNRPDHLENSKRYLQSLGMFLPEIPAPTPADVVIFSEKAVKERREALYFVELKGFPNKKYCMAISDSEQFKKCAKIASDDKSAHERLKTLEQQRKESPDSVDRNEIKELKQLRKDYKAMLLRFDAQAKKV